MAGIIGEVGQGSHINADWVAVWLKSHDAHALSALSLQGTQEAK